MKTFNIVLGCILLVILLLVGAYFGVLWWFGRKTVAGLTPQELVAFTQWQTVPIKLPPEALDVEPWRPETIEAAEAFRQAWIEHQASVSQSARPDAEPIASDLVEKEDALIEAFRRLVGQPDYEMAAITATAHPFAINMSGVTFFEPAQGVNVVLKNRAKALANDGRIEEGLSAAALMARGSLSNPYAKLMDQLISISVCAMSVKVWDGIVARCDDATLLRRTLQEQNSLAARVQYFPEAVPAMAFDNIGLGRELLRAGQEVKLDGLMVQDLRTETLRALADHLQDDVVPSVKDDPVLSQVVQNQIATDPMLVTMNANRLFVSDEPLPRIMRQQVEPLLFQLAYPIATESRDRSRIALSRLDLLRLKTAHKLFTLVEGREPTEMKELAPDYLPAIPIDPFSPSGGPFMKVPRYHSVGPDGVDNACDVIFNSRSGIKSKGDIVLGDPY